MTQEEKTVNELFEDFQGMAVLHYRANTTTENFKTEAGELQYMVYKIKKLVAQETLQELCDTAGLANWSKGLVKDFAKAKGIEIISNQ